MFCFVFCYAVVGAHGDYQHQRQHIPSPRTARFVPPPSFEDPPSAVAHRSSACSVPYNTVHSISALRSVAEQHYAADHLHAVERYKNGRSGRLGSRRLGPRHLVRQWNTAFPTPKGLGSVSKVVSAAEHGTRLTRGTLLKFVRATSFDVDVPVQPHYKAQ